jgi:hypothetical protein
VSGGEVGAKNATLSIMVGGPQEAFDKVKPLFELMGKNITLVGGNGDGQTTKVANQIIVALNIEACAEALLFAAKAGADPAQVRQALMGGFASSKILEVHGERMIKRTFDPGLPDRAASEGPEPRAVQRAALGVSLPNTATAQELFNSCARTAARRGITRRWSRRSSCCRTSRFRSRAETGSANRSRHAVELVGSKPLRLGASRMRGLNDKVASSPARQAVWPGALPQVLRGGRPRGRPGHRRGGSASYRDSCTSTANT